MIARFLSNLTSALGGALLLTAMFAFALPTAAWLGLSAACAVTVMTLITFPLRGRGVLQRTFDLAVVAVGAWTIVASRTYSGHPLKWLLFASATAMLTLGVTALTAAQFQLAQALRSRPAVREDAPVAGADGGGGSGTEGATPTELRAA